MKQVIFAIALLAMASLTGCLTDDESSVDDNTDTTSDNTGNTNDNSNDNTDSGDEGMLDPVGSSGGYSPPETANITISNYNGHKIWVSKNSHQIQTSCIPLIRDSEENRILIYDSDDRIIYVTHSTQTVGTYTSDDCQGGIRIDITLGPEPAKVEADQVSRQTSTWIVTF